MVLTVIPITRKPVKFASGPSKKKYDGMSALDKVKSDIRAKYGKGAIMDTKEEVILNSVKAAIFEAHYYVIFLTTIRIQNC